MKLTRLIKVKNKRKPVKFFYSPRFLRRKVKVFVTILRIAFEQMSYDE
jgi:hypothetical protein